MRVSARKGLLSVVPVVECRLNVQWLVTCSFLYCRCILWMINKYVFIRILLSLVSYSITIAFKHWPFCKPLSPPSLPFKILTKNTNICNCFQYVPVAAVHLCHIWLRVRHLCSREWQHEGSRTTAVKGRSLPVCCEVR